MPPDQNCYASSLPRSRAASGPIAPSLKRPWKACRKYKAKLGHRQAETDFLRNVTFHGGLMERKRSIPCRRPPSAKTSPHDQGLLTQVRRNARPPRSTPAPKPALQQPRRGVSSSAARDRPQSTKRDRRAPCSEHGPLRRYSRSWLECRPAPWLRS